MQEMAFKICSRGKYMYIPSQWWFSQPMRFSHLSITAVPYPGIKSAKLDVRMKSEWYKVRNNGKIPIKVESLQEFLLKCIIREIVNTT